MVATGSTSHNRMQFLWWVCGAYLPGNTLNGAEWWIYCCYFPILWGITICKYEKQKHFWTQWTRSSQNSMHAVARIPSSCEIMLTIQTSRKRLILVTPRHHTKKRMDCSAAMGVQYAKLTVSCRITVATFIGVKKIIFENQTVAMAVGTSNYMFVTEESTEDMLGVTKTSK